jgi:hypothetical protein
MTLTQKMLAAREALERLSGEGQPVVFKANR